ncbi:MAG: 1-deoxy-D-xylulose-5-phosphate reductoisomerase [Chloroherpetonaceae bacterium]|nr:1-deoxy-D-xylulose-5-phosphate reductoisomerase [Chloroherpetonaceae bacterium]MDW8438431.1 1-deoxy-D-xylulose-5-phosphate reductoisomerase [Chloroherpetonaceae bacterium]
MKRIALLGSTGSIGRSSLDVMSRFPDQFKAQYLSANDNVDLLAEQAKRFKPRGVVIANEALEPVLREKLRGEKIEVMSGKDALCEIARRSDVDFVIGAMVGFSGLKPTIEALKAGKDVGLANKETLVVAGEIVTDLSKRFGGRLLPIDSEHSAIFQCLAGENSKRIGKIILTASGGPFRTLPKEKFADITIESALNHPNWKMGKKITIDSATLMNKGLEVIEAKWLFGVAIEQIEVVVHPQSIIHSMVEFCDGSVKAQLGTPDMKIPIQYALTYPDRFEADYPRIDWKTLTRLDFETPDTERFRCLTLAFESIRQGGSHPCVLNAANEVAVELFLNGKIPFVKIPELIEQALEAHSFNDELSIDALIEIDAQTRQLTYERAKAVEAA